MMKKLINTPHRCVEEAIEGALMSDSRLMKVEGHNILVRKDIANIKQKMVTIISGGGSGHEPAHAGYVGPGMLSAAVLGNVFASPSVSSILAAIRVVAGPMGVLLIIKNYTGDRLNFGMAAEMAKQEGILVEMVIVADDCALPLGKGITGGRGLAGTVFVHKIAGARASEGASLSEVLSTALSVGAYMGTLGIALTTCTVPGTPVSDRLSQIGLIEVGMGIHGEPGREQVVLPGTGAADFVANLLVSGVLDQPDAPEPASTAKASHKRLSYTSGQRVVVLMNNLGALPVIEMQIVTGGVMRGLRQRGLVPVRAYCGPFMTSLEMCGVSLSLLMIPEGDDCFLTALDANVCAPGWVKSSELTVDSYDIDNARVISYSNTHTASKSCAAAGNGVRGVRDLVVKVTRLVCEKIIVLEPQLTAYDAICGDGDCGIVMKRGAEHVLHNLDAIQSACGGESVADTEATVELSAYFNQLGDALSASMGGTSGVLLELCFRAMASRLSAEDTNKNKEDTGEACGLVTMEEWTTALRAGVNAIGFYGGAAEGMRTMLDALLPAVSALEAGRGMKDAAAQAMVGMTRTAHMDSQAGRSNYVSQERMRGTPDPGAFAVAAAFAVMADHERL